MKSKPRASSVLPHRFTLVVIVLSLAVLWYSVVIMSGCSQLQPSIFVICLGYYWLWHSLILLCHVAVINLFFLCYDLLCYRVRSRIFVILYFFAMPIFIVYAISVLLVSLLLVCHVILVLPVFLSATVVIFCLFSLFSTTVLKRL